MIGAVTTERMLKIRDAARRETPDHCALVILAVPMTDDTEEPVQVVWVTGLSPRHTAHYLLQVGQAIEERQR